MQPFIIWSCKSATKNMHLITYLICLCEIKKRTQSQLRELESPAFFSSDSRESYLELSALMRLQCHQRKGGWQSFWSITSSASAPFTQSGCLRSSGSYADYPRHTSYTTIPTLNGLATLGLWAKTLPTALTCRVSSWDTAGISALQCKGLVRKYSPQTRALVPPQPTQFVPTAIQTLPGDLMHILTRVLQGALFFSLLNNHAQYTKCK